MGPNIPPIVTQIYPGLQGKVFSFLFGGVWWGVHLQHMEVPRLKVELELQLPGYIIATAMPDLNHICELHHSSQQCQVLNPLREARDRTLVLMDTNQICYC